MLFYTTILIQLAANQVIALLVVRSLIKFSLAPKVILFKLTCQNSQWPLHSKVWPNSLNSYQLQNPNSKAALPKNGKEEQNPRIKFKFFISV